MPKYVTIPTLDTDRAFPYEGTSINSQKFAYSMLSWKNLPTKFLLPYQMLTPLENNNLHVITQQKAVVCFFNFMLYVPNCHDNFD